MRNWMLNMVASRFINDWFKRFRFGPKHGTKEVTETINYSDSPRCPSLISFISSNSA